MNELTTLLIKTKEGLRLEESGNEESLLKRVDRLLEILLLPSYRNLRVKTNTTNPTFQIDISYDALRIENIYSEDFSATLDITVSGLLGLDTGTEQSDIWYYLWVIAKEDGTVSSILSASATSPALPSGYTKKRLVSYVRNTSGNFVAFYQQDARYIYASVQEVLDTATETSYTEKDCAVQIPETVNHIHINIVVRADYSSHVWVQGWVQGYINGSYELQIQKFAYGYQYAYQGSDHSLYTYNRKFEYKTSSSSATAKYISWLGIYGFEVPLEPY